MAAKTHVIDGGRSRWYRLARTGSVPRMPIRDCTPGDLDPLEWAQPTGMNRSHARKLERQLADECTYLLAHTDDGELVGHCEIVWNGCRSPEVQTAYPDTPEINGLVVYPGEWRGKGFGTGLIRTAEQRARQRGYHRIGVGAGEDNPRAMRLYRRLGYGGGSRTSTYGATWTPTGSNTSRGTQESSSSGT
jgi:GNAT superfamily N-acetyltransferase